ncbi:class I SAM-dependent methyltransferase [Glutamicibacter arilaitensis]|uniref:SAM-dependent methyltransferase n=1 Tax=Glutamicibacter arilaitensis TaxID=256701 RepID=A0A2N7S4X0_9MICC|nr:class I SAM-dependent methyltransferase [Glutamicibacter arilaitensis]PMQ21205.1 SAM-dependent methyltransferase [Glutamicibacter arilaitensis]
MTQQTNYDEFAEAYAAENESNMLNAYYERPAMLELAGNVAGRRMLDAGCGAGPLLEKLQNRGAKVTGFDASPAMVELARQRLGGDADIVVADLGRRLPFADESFDDVTASLVFHYLQDWAGALSEVRRVLRPGGRLMLSVNHPLVYPWTHPGTDYFVPVRYTDEHTFAGQPAALTYWHRPLRDMTQAFTDAGFRIEQIHEPPYSSNAPEEIVPEPFRERDSFLSFIFFVLSAG